MKISDPLLHEQLHHVANTGRKAISAKTFIVLAGVYDEDAECNASILAFCLEGEDKMPGEDQLSEIIDITSKCLSNVLTQSTHLELILRDKRTGEEIDIADSIKSGYGVRVDP